MTLRKAVVGSRPAPRGLTGDALAAEGNSLKRSAPGTKRALDERQVEHVRRSQSIAFLVAPKWIRAHGRPVTAPQMLKDATSLKPLGRIE